MSLVRTAVLAAALLAACTGGAPARSPGPPDGGAPQIAADRELVIVDSSVVLDERASSASGGPWSFRGLMEQLGGSEAPRLVEAWLKSLRATSVDGAEVEDRAAVEDLLAAWPRSADGTLDLASAPFRLLAIVNRIDLATSTNGEGRFVFGLVDPATGAPGRMTVGFEYRLPPLGTANDRQEWARRWHALAREPFGPAYAAALEKLTREFASAGLDAGGVNGSALSQLRTNEAQFGRDWEQRQWVLDRDAAGPILRPVRTPATPAQALNGSAQLAQWLLDNQGEVLLGQAALPREMLGGAAREAAAWSFRDQPAVPAPLRHAFAVQTCNGCHSSETGSARGYFHIDPFAPPGPGRLSEYLRNSQLPERALNLAALLQGGAPVPHKLPGLPPPPAAPAYDLVPIPAGDDAAPVALDAHGHVLGNSSRGPWIWDGSTIRIVAGPEVHATGWNDQHEIAADQGTGPSRTALILGPDGRITSLGTLGGSMSLATGISATRLVAGDSLTGSGEYHGFLFNGSLLDLGTLGGAETMTAAINVHGQVTGDSQAADGTRHAFIADAAGMRDIGTLGGDFAAGQAINDRGQVAGMSETVPGGDSRIHAFFYDGATLHDLGALPGLPWSSATGLNNQGVVVGNVFDKPGYGAVINESNAYVWRDGVMVNLNDLVQPSSVKLRAAIGVNDAGQILCSDGPAGAATANAYLLIPR